MAILDTIKLSKNKRPQWLTLNPILADLEIGYEEDTKLFKIGNGITHWNALPYTMSGNPNALFISLSTDPDNLITMTPDGGIIFRRSLLNGVAAYVSGREQGASAPTVSNDYEFTLVRVGQDVKSVMDLLTSLTQRVSETEGFVPGDRIDDAKSETLTTWSSEKISDYILNQVLDLKNELTGNPQGAYDALVRLSDLLENNASLAVTVAEELANSVKFDVVQTLTAQQKSNVLTSIGALDASEVGDVSTLFDDYEAALSDSTDSPFKNNEL